MKRSCNERGTVALEFALVVPALMVLVLGIAQFGLWYHAQHVTRTAAIEAARVAAAEDGDAEAAEARAAEVLAAGLGRAAESPLVDVTIQPQLARAMVSARMSGLLPIPGLSSFALHAEASSYRERFRARGEDP